MPEPETISILVVDDDLSFIDSFRIFLGREPGIIIETLPSGTGVPDLLDERFFDVIIADDSLPDIDGIALLKEVRARGCRSLFVIVTGKRNAQIAIDALNNGADYYLQKGSDTAKEFSRLVSFIRAGVSKSHAEHGMMEWERFYYSVVESTPDLICRILPDGSLTYANESCLHFFKRTYDDMIGQNLFSLIPAEERPAVLARLRNLSARKPNLLLEHRVRTGGITPILQWYYHGFFPEHGEVAEYLVSGRSTEGLIRIGRKGAARAAFHPEAVVLAPGADPQKAEDPDWNGLFDTIRLLEKPAFAVDRSGMVIAWNPAIEQLTGVGASQMVGRGRQEYAIPFCGKRAPMVIDHILLPPGMPAAANLPAITKSGDACIGEMERVMIKGRPVLLWGKGSPVYDGKGALTAAIEVITVCEPRTDADAPGPEKYLGGVSGNTLKVSGDGLGGALAGAIGSSTGGYGVYATDRRVFVIRNPDLTTGKVAGAGFGTFILDELFGTTIDTRPRTIRELEKFKVFEAWKKDIASIGMKKPVLLSGYLAFLVEGAGLFRIYIDHRKSFTILEQLMESFCPEKIKRE